MTQRRSGSAISPEFRAEMDRVGLGVLEVIARHRKSPPPRATEPAPPGTLPGKAPRPASTTVPGRGRRKITSETRFRRAEGRTRIMPHSLRAKMLAFLASKPQATLAELEVALPSVARGVASKLIETGWLEIVS